MIERKDPVKYNTVTAKDLKQPTKNENAELKNLSQQVAIMSTKLEVMCNLLHTIIKSQREQKTIQSPENMVIEDTETDDDEENEIIPATPNQPTTLFKSPPTFFSHLRNKFIAPSPIISYS